MTKSEIKDLIIKSDYKNKDVVIWWQFTEDDDKSIYIAHCQYIEALSIGEYIWKTTMEDAKGITYLNTLEMIDELVYCSSKSDFKLKILEVDNE